MKKLYDLQAFFLAEEDIMREGDHLPERLGVNIPEEHTFLNVLLDPCIGEHFRDKLESRVNALVLQGAVDLFACYDIGRDEALIDIQDDANDVDRQSRLGQGNRLS